MTFFESSALTIDALRIALIKNRKIMESGDDRSGDDEKNASISLMIKDYQSGKLTGNDLAQMVLSGEITKTDRRKITKQAKKSTKSSTPNTTEKKPKEKLTKEERNEKFKKIFEEKREKEKSKTMICLGCRKRGHVFKNCPLAKSNIGICFNCGLNTHTLKDCPSPRGSKLKFAHCFICSKSGHIAKDCPENANGLYPNGGCCHICLQKTHLVRDCPQRTEEDRLEFSKKRELELEDEKLGPRIGQLAATDGRNGGDDIDFYIEDNGNDVESDDDNDVKPKKAKKSRSSKSDSDKSSKKKKHRSDL